MNLLILANEFVTFQQGYGIESLQLCTIKILDKNVESEHSSL